MSLAALGEFRQRNRVLADALVGKARGGDENSLAQLSQQTGVDKIALRTLLFEDATAKLFGLKKSDVVADQALTTKGIGQGGTVAHLSGFRGVALDMTGAKNVALLLPFADGKKVDGDAEKLVEGVDVAKISTMRGGDPPAGAIKLDKSIADALVVKLNRSISEKLAGVPRDHPEYEARGKKGIEAKLAESAKANKPDLELSDMLTLMTAKVPPNAFLDPKSGRITLGEDTPPLPEAYAKQIDVDAGMKLLGKLNDAQTPIDADTLRDTASSFPLAALKVLEKADITMRMRTFDTLYDPSTREEQLLGERAAKAMAEKNDNAGGVFRGLFATVAIIDGHTQHQRCTLLRHELAHAIDASLAPPGNTGSPSRPTSRRSSTTPRRRRRAAASSSHRRSTRARTRTSSSPKPSRCTPARTRTAPPC